MPDAWELAFGLNVGVNDSGDDPDRDGLSNSNKHFISTNPKKKDTDEDGLDDGCEANVSTTNPSQPDTFRLNVPQAGIRGIRLIGTEGGTASGGVLPHCRRIAAGKSQMRRIPPHKERRGCYRLPSVVACPACSKPLLVNSAIEKT
ncbi:MAG: hypothetical protein QHJ82_14575 [Verrucomicrobiota bacterium]|nr:hypothetical protein [Verrucomicrobiota bacterium]